MKRPIQFAIGAAALALIAACTTSDKAATPADTATGQSTTVAPASASAPVISAPVDSVPTAAPIATSKGAAAAKPKSSAHPKATGTGTTEPLRDSAFKPRATVDEQGNIRPIKRDTLK